MTQTKDMEVKQENAQTGETSEVRGMREKEEIKRKKNEENGLKCIICLHFILTELM